MGETLFADRQTDGEKNDKYFKLKPTNKIKYTGEDMQHGFVAERICAYYNFASCLCYSCTDCHRTLSTP
jgi:hypothetical protein